MDDADNYTIVALQFAKRSEQTVVGLAALTRVSRPLEAISDPNYPDSWKFEAFDFLDNDQLSNVDSVLIRFGRCVVYVADETDGSANIKIQKQLLNILHEKELDDYKVLKKSMFQKKTETASALTKLLGGALSQAVHAAESEHPLAYGSIGCIIFTRGLLCSRLSSDTSSSSSSGAGGDDVQGRYELSIGSLGACMRLDSAACEAINLLPKADQPSRFGSIYGILNRCKTKIGSRLLMRWIRQPLVNLGEINNRLDFVQLFVTSTMLRSQLTDGPLRSIPDVEMLMNRMSRKTANLGDAYRLYSFTKTLVQLESVLREVVNQHEYDTSIENAANEDLDDASAAAATDSGNSTDDSSIMQKLKSRYVTPLHEINDKFHMYQQLIEHVLDFSALPDFLVNAKHDEVLSEIKEEIDTLTLKIERTISTANRTWASGIINGEIKLEKSPQHGYICRTTKGEDERALRDHNKKVRIISVLKTGCYFTTPEMESLSDSLKGLEVDYKSKQQELTAQCIDTALTYMPLVDVASSLVSELDVLLSFATVAALSPAVYSRPVLYPLEQPPSSAASSSTSSPSAATAADATPQQNSGNARAPRVIRLKNARHPCVEMMDDMNFIPNDYALHSDTSRLQVITGPNMGGKSTYIRGIGSIVAMAQVGSFIPCDEGSEISIVDCILARVGAGDAVQKGVSTFMAEMLEASIILQTASPNSLIIIDELGRGTSTFDGYGLAWAISDYIISNVGCLALFATHFHELTALSKTYRCVTNKHVTAQIESDNRVVMLYHLQDGPCTQSYGIHVANMARFPSCVTKEAKRKAHELEQYQGNNQKQPQRSGSSSSTATSSGKAAEISAAALADARRTEQIQRKMVKFHHTPVENMKNFQTEVLPALKEVLM